MKTTALLVAAMMLTVPHSSHAQELDSTDYYPLAGGNTWTYYDIFQVPLEPPDTTIVGTFTIVDSVTVNDTLYFKAVHPNSLADTLRSDSGRVYARVGGRDVLLFDFLMGESDSYAFEQPGPFGHTMQVTIQRDLAVDVIAGHFENCVRFQFTAMPTDSDRSFTFAPGVGPLDAVGGMGEQARLYSAVVNGVPITATSVSEEGAGLVRGEAYAYPNPFGASTTLSFPHVGGLPADVIVYDMLGRDVDVVEDGLCGEDRCVYSWRGSGLGSGLYFARLDGHGGGTTARVMIRR